MLYFIVTIILFISEPGKPPVELMLKSQDEMGFVNHDDCQKKTIEFANGVLQSTFKDSQGVTVRAAVKCEQASTGS